MNQNVFRELSYGMYVVATLDGDRYTGCIANSVMQVSATPANIVLSINHDNCTNSFLKKSKKVAISILSEKSNPYIIGTFGFRSAKDINKFEEIEYITIDNLPVIKDSCGYLIGEITDCIEADTHTVFLAKITNGDVLSDDTPMTYAYYHNVIKGHSPKNAPTYLAQD